MHESYGVTEYAFEQSTPLLEKANQENNVDPKSVKLEIITVS
jgi:hypothetical protein